MTDHTTLPEAKRQRAQELFLDALASGLSRTESCHKAGLARQTFYNWFLHDQPFAELVRLAEEEALSLLEAALRRCAAKAEEDPRYQRSLIYLAERQERRRRDGERRAERRQEQARKDRPAHGRPSEEISRQEFMRRAEQARKDGERGINPPYVPGKGMPHFEKWLLGLDASNATPDQIAEVERQCAEDIAARAARTASPTPSETPEASPAISSPFPWQESATPNPSPSSRRATSYEGVTATIY